MNSSTLALVQKEAERYVKKYKLFSRTDNAFLAGAEYMGSIDGWIRVEDAKPECLIIDGKKKKTNWVLGTDGKIQFVCVYTKGHELEYGDEDPSDEEVDEIEEKNGCLYLKTGWYELEETPRGEYDETWVARIVTHWRRLPSSPDNK